MSNVPEMKRGKSGFQTVDTSRTLKKKVLQLCVKLPKRYTDLILKDIVDDAKDVARYVRKANSVFPHNQHEVQIRIDYWIRAWSTIQVLSDGLNDLLEIPSVLQYIENRKKRGATENELNEVADLVYEEMNLIKGSLEKDRKRFKSLP